MKLNTPMSRKKLEQSIEREKIVETLNFVSCLAELGLGLFAGMVCVYFLVGFASVAGILVINLSSSQMILLYLPIIFVMLFDTLLAVAYYFINKSLRCK